MSDLVADSARVPAPPEAVWALLDDPRILARILPGAESIEAAGPGRFRGVLASRLQFLTIRADVTAELHDPDPPRSVRLELAGRPRGIAGSFRVSVPFELEPQADGATLITYRVELAVTGRLAAFGRPLLRDTMRRQIAQLVANVERELTPAAP